MNPISFDQTAINHLENITTPIKSIRSICHGGKMKSEQNKNINSIKPGHINNPKAYLVKEKVQKMICRILHENKMSQTKLADFLKISLKELSLVLSQEESLALIHKINFPLIQLYCSIKFNNK